MLIPFILDGVPQSLATLLEHAEASTADGRPTKRRKVAKPGKNSLRQSNGISATGITLGYIPLARLALRLVSRDLILKPEAR